MSVLRVILLTGLAANVAAMTAPKESFLKMAKNTKKEPKAEQNPSIPDVVSHARDMLSTLNATSDSVKDLLTTVNTSGCEFTTAAANALDALSPALDTMKSAVDAISSLPWIGQSVDDIKQQVTAFVDDLIAQVESVKTSLESGCSTLAGELGPMLTQFEETEATVFANFESALQKLEALAPGAQALMMVQQGGKAKTEWWPFGCWFGCNKGNNQIQDARTAILKANSSVAMLVDQLDSINHTAIEAVVNDVVTTITDALTNFQNQCLTHVGNLPSTYTTQAAVYCTKSTDYVDTVTNAVDKVVATIPVAVQTAKDNLVKVYPVADSVLAAIDQVDQMALAAASSS